MAPMDVLLTPWARATLRRLFVGAAPWWAMPGAWLRRQVGRDARVADLWYRLADYDHAVADALHDTPSDAARALRVRGFKARALAYFDGEGAPSRAPAAGAFVLACAALALVVTVPGGPTPDTGAPLPDGSDIFTPRGPDADAGLRVDVLCLDALGQLVHRASESNTPCPLTGIAQPVVTDEAASGLHVAVFVVQPGPTSRITPMLPNPAEVSTVQLDALGTEQRVGPARRLAVNYEPGPGFVVFVFDDRPMDWQAVESLHEQLSIVTPIVGGPSLADVVTGTFAGLWWREPVAVHVHRFDLAPADP